MKKFLSLRIVWKLVAMAAGFLVLLFAIIWAKASLAWGVSTSLQWAWFVIALIAGVSSFWSSIKEVSNKSLWILTAVDVFLIAVVWWL